MKLDRIFEMGGGAFPNVSRIKKEDIEPTLQYLEKLINIPEINMEYIKNNLMGSVGKQADSGDIDIALDQTKFTKETLKNIAGIITVKLGARFVNTDGLNAGQLNVLVPIKGNSENGDVQVDFILGPSDWLKFTHYSPGKEASIYKGVFISTIIGVMAKIKKDVEYWVPGFEPAPGTKDDDIDYTKRVAKVGWAYDLEKGLIRRWFMQLKPNQNVSEVDANYWESNVHKVLDKHNISYDKIPRFSRTGYIDNPEDAIRILFGEHIPKEVFAKFETLFQWIKENTDPGLFKQIKERTIAALKRSAAKKEYDIDNLTIFNEAKDPFGNHKIMTVEKKKKKAGLLPYFIKNKKVYVCLMIPSDSNFGGSYPQIAKGKIEKNEKPLDGAVREGCEELGIKAKDIKNVWLVYPDIESPAEPLHVYAAEMKNMNNSKWDDETLWPDWYEIPADISSIRDWQQSIVLEFLKKLKTKTK